MKSYKKGTHIIVDWDYAGDSYKEFPKECIISKERHLDRWSNSKMIQTHYSVKVYDPKFGTHGKIVTVPSSRISLDLQYYREKRLKQILGNNNESN